MSTEHADLPERPARNWWLWGTLALAALIGGALLISGDPDRTTGRGQGPDENMARDLFASGADTLDRLEEFDTEPALRLVLDRWNQWILMEAPQDPWKLDPLVETLPTEPDLKNLPMLKTAGTMKFQPDDGNHLLETGWLRNIARGARGDQADDLARALNLFDWTVRNIQLEDWSIRQGRAVEYRPAKLTRGLDKKNDISYLARDVLLFGRGDYVQRAWVFMLLARQENLDAVLLAVPDEDAPQGLRPWLPALLHKGNLYLLDTYLGLPLRSPDGEVLTLDKVLANPELLKEFDSPKEPYPLTAEELKGLVAYVEGSPAYLTRRMQAAQARLAGDKKVVLTANPSVLAEKVRSIPGITDVKLWPMPFEVLHERHNATNEMMETIRFTMAPFMLRYPTPRMRDRNVSLQDEHPLFMGQQQGQEQAVQQAAIQHQWCSLWTGRIMHFKGTYTSEGAVDGALQQYMTLIVKDSDVDEWITKFSRAGGISDQPRADAFRTRMREVIPAAKQSAMYWLGLIAHDRGNYSTSVDFLNRLRNSELRSVWHYGATYNLARTYEEQAEKAKDPKEAAELLKQAIELLEQDDSAQQLGNRLRAKLLKDKLSQTEAGP